MKVLDTCFLIDLQREFYRQQVGDARRFLELRSATRFAISMISLTEFLEGFPNGSMARGERLLRPFRWLDVDTVISREASRIRRDLRLAGRLIGDFDILIAATAKVHGVPMVTDDSSHFRRIDGLHVESYSSAGEE